MNKKLYIGVMLILLGASFVSAQEVTERRVMIREGVPQMMGVVSVQPTNAGGVVSGRPAVVTGSAMMVPPGQMAFPTTGDANKDAQIKALILEMNTKMEAIRKEYETKLRAIIGDKPLINNQGRSSTTPGILRVREVREEMMGQYDGEGTSTGRMMPIQGRPNENRPMYIGERQNYGGGEGVGLGTQFGNFLRGLFGGGR